MNALKPKALHRFAALAEKVLRVPKSAIGERLTVQNTKMIKRRITANDERLVKQKD